jgi:hypothetical protein
MKQANCVVKGNSYLFSFDWQLNFISVLSIFGFPLKGVRVTGTKTVADRNKNGDTYTSGIHPCLNEQTYHCRCSFRKNRHQPSQICNYISKCLLSNCAHLSGLGINTLHIPIDITLRGMRKHLGFEVLTAVSTKMAVFWVVAPCSLVEVYQRFRGPCCLHYQGDETHHVCLLLIKHS